MGVGNRKAMSLALLFSACGVLITLIANLWVVILGLGFCCTGIFVCQAAIAGQVGKGCSHSAFFRRGFIRLYLLCRRWSWFHIAWLFLGMGWMAGVCCRDCRSRNIYCRVDLLHLEGLSGCIRRQVVLADINTRARKSTLRFQHEPGTFNIHINT